MLVRVEDLDRNNSSQRFEDLQKADLNALGLTHEGAILRQSERFDVYRSIIAELMARDLVYPCYCSRREVREAASAPQGSHSHVPYPGTCRELSSAERVERESNGRPPALRLRTNGERYAVSDVFVGDVHLDVDDFVLQRNDGVPSYNLAVVVDDALQGVEQIVRGDDLLASTGRHVHLQRLLGYRTPEYVHVPLVLGGDGERLAKRHGAVTLADLAERGVTPSDVLQVLAQSIGVRVEGPHRALDVLTDFSWTAVPRSAWTIPVAWQTGDR